MKTKILMIALMALPFFMSCSDDDIIEGGNGDIDNIVEEVPARFYVDWNATISIVKDSTIGYNLVSSDTDFLHYYSEKLTQTVSYEFADDLLKAVAVVLPETDSVQMLTDVMLEGYNFIGDKDSVAVFVSELKNTFAVKYLTSEFADSTSENHVVVGFTPLN